MITSIIVTAACLFLTPVAFCQVLYEALYG